MTNTGFARCFLALNAAFSMIAGIAIMIAPAFFAGLIFADPASWLTPVMAVLGAGLAIFAADVRLLASDRHLSRKWVYLVCVADLAWIAGSAVLVLGFGHVLTASGVLIVDVLALMVAIFATGQFVGTRRFRPLESRASVTREKGAVVFEVRRPVRASTARVWEVMTDHPAYADVATNLSKVEVVSGEGIGLVRRCYGPKGESWTETCDRFEEGRLYEFSIHTEAPDYPYPIAKLRGQWSVTPSDRGAEFAIRITATPKGSWLSRFLFSALAALRFRSLLLDLAERWAERMETGDRGEAERAADPQQAARLAVAG